MTRQLLIIAGPEKGRSFSLEDGQTLVIGRGQASDTQINDPTMSRVHCHLQIDGGETLLIDNKSSSGTWMGGERIESRALQPGDVFVVGESQLRYQLDQPGDASTIMADRAFTPAAPQESGGALADMIGQSLAHYRLDSIIAEGNSGAVFKAFDTENNRPAAVKVLTPDPTRSEEQKERFVRAMKTMLPVKHPYIVQLYNAGKTGPYCWAAMEYIDGENMASVIERIGVEGMLDWREAYRAAVHIGRALREAHERKIIHRNVTPTNLIRRKSDRACLLGDLMLAKALEGSLARQVTQPGQLVGDVPYMSPERTRDQVQVDHRSDMYGLGATLYAMLTGRPPFESKSLPELVRMVRELDPPDPKSYQLAINDQFCDAVLHLLAKNPDDRFQTPDDLLRDLERIGKFNNLQADWSEWSG